MARARSVARSATSGRFVTKAYARRAPGRTTVERVGGGTGNRRAVHRDAGDGRFVSARKAAANPRTTITQHV